MGRTPPPPRPRPKSKYAVPMREQRSSRYGCKDTESSPILYYPLAHSMYCSEHRIYSTHEASTCQEDSYDIESVD